MSAIVCRIIGAACALALSVLAQKTGKPAKTYAEGWKVLHPGWLINASIVASTGMSAVFGYIWIFVGSSRSDAEAQTLYAFDLFFGFSAFYLAWPCQARMVM